MIFQHCRLALALSLIAGSLLGACRSPSLRTEVDLKDSPTHGKNAPPNYELVFGTEEVHRIDFKIDAEAYAAMQQDLAIALVTDARPAWVDATVEHEGLTWKHVGIRFTGLKAVESAQEAGSGKYPFKLNFDEFEDTFTATKNQRFHGFKRLNFATHFKDDSYVREILATEAFRDAGVPAARAAFYEVHVDVGNGSVYWGLYTVLEDPDDVPMVKAQFGEHGGNLYEPSGPGADFSSFVEVSFAKKNNQAEADFSDVQGAIAALNATDLSAEAWRTGLEETFNVDGFLNFLAVNTLMVNGDAYGCKAENYYLYGVPSENGRLYFLPTDLNEAFLGSMVSCGSRNATAPQDTPADIFHESLIDTMPLITLLLADSTYREIYADHLAAALDGALAEDALEARATELHDLIAPYVVGSSGETPAYTTLSSEAAFSDALSSETGLFAHMDARRILVQEALDAE